VIRSDPHEGVNDERGQQCRSALTTENF